MEESKDLYNWVKSILGDYKVIDKPPVAAPYYGWWILKDRIPVKATSAEFMEWSSDIENKIVQQTVIGDYRVSTVFLGLDHSFNPMATAPLIFETMIFKEEGFGKRTLTDILNEVKSSPSEDENEFEHYQERYFTWEEAEKGHHRACAQVLE